MPTSRISGQRLDVVLQRLRDTEEPSPIVDSEEFKAFLRGTTDRQGSAQQSSESLLIDFIMPMVSDARIFEGSQTILLLQHLRDDILAYMSDNEELTQLATKIINDEIERHNYVLEKRQSGIAA
jgi:hypothetical protein